MFENDTEKEYFVVGLVAGAALAVILINLLHLL